MQRASHYTKNKILILCHAMGCMTRPGLSLQLISFHSVSPIKLSSHLRDPIKLISALGLCICSSISHPSHPAPCCQLTSFLSLGSQLHCHHPREVFHDYLSLTTPHDFLSHLPILFLYHTYHDLKLSYVS